MRKTKLLYSLALAPLLLGAYGGDVSQISENLTVQTLPLCQDGQFLIYRNGAVTCETIQGSGVALPDCKTPGQLLTYTSNGELSQYSCTPKGSIMISATDITNINKLQSDITLIGSTVTALGMGTPIAARVFRGLSTNKVDGAMGGTKAASLVCANQYGPGTTMCDAYSMYVSIAAGKIDVTKDITGAWVYLADWTGGINPATFAINSNAQVAASLADNCGGYTSNSTTSGVFGTSFSNVINAAAGSGNTTERLPRFSNKTLCSTMLQIACCQ